MVMTVCEWGWWMRWNMILEMARRELCKPDASTVSICSLYTIEKRFSGTRESCHFWFRSREFAAKREFRSLFRAERIGFEGYGRTFFHFFLFLFYFQLRADRFSWRHASWGYRNTRQMMLWNPRPQLFSRGTIAPDPQPSKPCILQEYYIVF